MSSYHSQPAHSVRPPSARQRNEGFTGGPMVARFYVFTGFYGVKAVISDDFVKSSKTNAV